MELRSLLVIGAPRSGTRYLARWLRQCGLKVGHEQVGPEGCVSSYFTVDDFWYHGPHGKFGQRRSGFTWGQVWHVWRDPLKTIASIATMRQRSWWHWQSKHTGIDLCEEPKRVTAARFWVDWTDRCLSDPEVKVRVPIERLDEMAMDLLRRISIDPPTSWPEIDRSPSRSTPLPLDPSELPKSLALRIEELRERLMERACPNRTPFSTPARDLPRSALPA